MRAIMAESQFLAGCITFAALVVQAGCASTHNRKTDGFNPSGGGFYEQEILPGFYRMTASSNRSLWPTFGAAIDTWRGRADQLCGSNQYQEIVASQDAGYQGAATVHVRSGIPLSAPLYNTTITGHILCNNSGMTRSQAIAYLDEQAKRRATEENEAQARELDELGGKNCGTDDQLANPENLLRRGKILSSRSEYQSALACFMRAQALEEGTSAYREACIAIGTMLELGWGVEKNLQEAMTWYKKGGLATDN
jgi:tetratricopeptide (TPR) repeat protein